MKLELNGAEDVMEFVSLLFWFHSNLKGMETHPMVLHSSNPQSSEEQT